MNAKRETRDTKQDWLSRDIVKDSALIMVKFLILLHGWKP